MDKNQLTHSPQELLKKHVAIIHISGNLSLLEKKLANVLLLNAYENLLLIRTHRISVQDLKLILGWEEGQNIGNLRKALTKLASTTIEFNIMGDGEEDWSVTSFISFGNIANGVCTYRYDEYVAEKLHNPAIYAKINLGIQRLFSSGYSVSLYENCIRYIKTGSTGWLDLPTIRKLLGATQEYYEDFRRLNNKILDKSIKEINTYSDIEIDCFFKKEARKVVAIKFIVKKSKNPFIEAAKTDEFGYIREKDIFQKLREHGFSDEKAILYIAEDEERVRKVVALAEEKDKEGKIKSTTAGFIRTLLDEKADVGKSVYQANKENNQEKQKTEAIEKEKQTWLEEKKQQYLQEEKKAIVKNLNQSEKIELAKQFLETDEGKVYIASFKHDSEKLFSNPVARLMFNGWLIKNIKLEYDESKFNDFLKSKLNK